MKPKGAPAKKPVTESQFYMWRTLFAIAHVDNVVSDEEVRFMAEAMEDVPFTPEQKTILTQDSKAPQDIVQMFMKISDNRDQAKFFRFAHDLVWADGSYGAAEQEIMLKLKREHMKTVNVDDLVGNIDLQLEETAPASRAPQTPEGRKKRTKDIVFSFRKAFVKDKLN